MTIKTFYPNLRIARELKIVTKKNKVVGAAPGSYNFSVFFDGRLLGTVYQELVCLAVSTTILPGDCRLLVDALRAKGASRAEDKQFAGFDVEDVASCMIADILREEDSLKRAKRLTKTKTLVVLQNQKPGTWDEFKLPFTEENKAKVIAYYQENPSEGVPAIFINEDIADL